MDYKKLIEPIRASTDSRERYRGDGFGISLTDLHPQDQADIRQAYDVIKRIYTTWLVQSDKPLGMGDLLAAVAALCEPDLLSVIKRMGTASYGPDMVDESIRKAIHDIRAGALTALLGNAQLSMLTADSETWMGRLAGKGDRITKVVYFARDHAKIMRNAILDLDEELRLLDESESTHDIAGMVEAWQDATLEMKGRTIALDLEIEYSGDISCCCLEISAIDRVIYNMINNAARFTSSGRVTIASYKAHPQAVCLVVANPVTEEQAAWTMASTNNDPAKLFMGGITDGGQGIGLTNCVSIVTAAFGKMSQDETLQHGLVGANIDDGHFVAWFHWPVL